MKRVCLLLCGVLTATARAQQAQTLPRPSLSERVVVLGTAEPVTEGESARSTVVLDTQQHPMPFREIEDYLRTDSSVDIQQRAGAGILSDISIRGGSFEQTLVLLNGMRVDNAETSHFNLDVPVPLLAVRSIDVLHGTGSTLYGSDALSGVVNVSTLKPDSTHLRLRSGFGSFGGNEQSFLGSMFSAKASEVLAGSRDASAGFVHDRDYDSLSGSSEGRLNTKLGQTDLLLAGSNRQFGAAHFFGNYDSFEHTKGWFGSLNQEFGSSTQAAAAYRRHSDIFLLSRVKPDGSKNQHIDQSWEGVVRRKQPLSSAANLFIGLEEDTDQIRSTNLGNHGRNRGAGYLDLDLHAKHRVSISLGLREEVLSGGHVVTSPMLGSSLWAGSSLKVRGSLGYGFRLPTFLDLYYTDPSTLGDPNLRPESAWNYEGGADWYPTRRSALSLTVFHSRQTDAIDYTRASAAQPWRATNLAAFGFTGVEAAVDVSPRPAQRVRLSWTFLSGAQSALNGLMSMYVFNYPVHNASAEWTSSLRGGVLLRTRIGVVERVGRDPYGVWDVGLARERGRFHPFLRMTNLSNTSYQEIVGVPMPGRAFAGGVEIFLRRSGM